MFPDNLYISDPTEGRLYVVENDVVTSSMSIIKEARAILVCQNMADIYTVNRDENTVTRIHNGEAIGDIRVGKMPYGICEDINGRIYVTNYADYTVSVIENGQVSGLPIPVSSGPRGIVADYNGNIWVACYLTNTVVKITNRTVVDEIDVPFNPEGITCSPNNDIWVACSGSNVAVKISNGKKKLTIATGKCPVAIVCDKKGNVFTANFEDDSVTMIATTKENQTATISVGDGPSAIAVNSQNLIYVTSNLSGEKVYKINPSTQQVIGKIQVCKSQCAFGDFTGCAAYNVFYPNGRDGVSGNISSQAVTNVVQSLKPTFKATIVSEATDSVVVKVTSDLLDLNKFNKLTLNEIEANEDGTFTIGTNAIGDELQLIGYFNDDSSDPVVFKSVRFTDVFKIYVGIVDSNYANYLSLKEKMIDFSSKDVATVFVQQPTKGHMVVFVPSRSLDVLKDGMMVQGNYNIGDNWKTDLGGSSEPAATTDIVIQGNIDRSQAPELNVYPIVKYNGSNYDIVVTSGSNTLANTVDYDILEFNTDDGDDPVTEGGITYSKYWVVNMLRFTKVVDDKITITLKDKSAQPSISGNATLDSIYTATGWSQNQQKQYSILINNYETNAAEKWMFNFYNVLA